MVITGATGLIGVGLGGFITYRVQEHALKFERDELRKNLSLAIAAEIEAYLEMIALRKHEEYAKSIIELNKKGIRTIPKGWISGFEANRIPFPVIMANLPNIGILGSICKNVVSFYSQSIAIRTTLISANEGIYDEATNADLAEIFEGELELWMKTKNLGKNIVNKLRNII